MYCRMHVKLTDNIGNCISGWNGTRKMPPRRHSLMAQFCYEHQEPEWCIRKIRKNAEELCKILDSMPSPKERKGKKE